MKKLFFFLLIVFPLIIKGNPVVSYIYISEIYFDENGDWFIELGNFYDYFYDPNYDSIAIESLDGYAGVVNYYDIVEYAIITNEYLNNPISLNKDSDLIRLHLYYDFGDGYVFELPIGNYENSYLKNIENNYCVATKYEGGYYYIDSIPTPGVYNDLLGAITGKIYGYFYKKDNSKITNEYFQIREGYSSSFDQLDDYNFINDIGFYISKITSRVYELDAIMMLETTDPYPQFNEFYIQKVNFILDENDSLKIDFYESNLDDLNNQNVNKIILTNYPNPANDYTYFIYDLNNKYNIKEDFSLSIYSNSGSIIELIPINPQLNKLRWDCSHIINGTYIYILRNNSQVIKSGQLLICR